MVTVQARRLTRSETDKRIAGVCGGVAEYFGVDPTLVRVVFVVTALTGGAGLLLYLILWIALPVGPAGAPCMGPSPWSAVRIAEERYARGEIGADELGRIRADLTGG